DGAPQSGLQPHFLLDEVSTLGELEPAVAATLAEPHPARTAEHRAGHQERDEGADNLVEGDPAVDQVVLVGAVTGALAVGVVLVEGDLSPAGHLIQDPAGRSEEHTSE